MFRVCRIFCHSVNKQLSLTEGTPREKWKGFSGIADLEASLIKERNAVLKKSRGITRQKIQIFRRDETNNQTTKIFGIVCGYSAG